MQILRNLFNLPASSRYSVAALLDAEHHERMLSIWDDLDSQLGIKFPFADPIPHLTHIQAKDIDDDKLHEAMHSFAAIQSPYTLTTSGLGIFTGDKAVVYINIVRNPALNRIHSRIIDQVYTGVNGIQETHLINYWMPHLTLVMPSMGNGQLPEIIHLLASRDLAWGVTVRELALLDSDAEDNPRFTVTLSGDES